MASPYDKMTLAQLREEMNKRLMGVIDRLEAPPGAAAESRPEPAEPPVTDMPLEAARAQAAKKAAIQGVR